MQRVDQHTKGIGMRRYRPDGDLWTSSPSALSASDARLVSYPNRYHHRLQQLYHHHQVIFPDEDMMIIDDFATKFLGAR